MTAVDAVKRVLDDYLLPNAKYDRLGPLFRNNFLWRAEVRWCACLCTGSTPW